MPTSSWLPRETYKAMQGFLPILFPMQGIYGDLSWDAACESKVNMRSDGWSVEIKIPLSSIRFSNKNTDEWGIQFLRYNRNANETSFWNPH